MGKKHNYAYDHQKYLAKKKKKKEKQEKKKLDKLDRIKRRKNGESIIYRYINDGPEFVYSSEKEGLSQIGYSLIKSCSFSIGGRVISRQQYCTLCRLSTENFSGFCSHCFVSYKNGEEMLKHINRYLESKDDTFEEALYKIGMIRGFGISILTNKAMEYDSRLRILYFIKNTLLRIKLKKLIPVIEEIYYQPSGKKYETINKMFHS